MNALTYRARQAGRSRTLTSDGRFTPAQHTDVICPPDQGAECANCGDELRFHWVEAVDIVKDLGATCPNTYGDVFALAAGDSLDCEHVTACSICDVDVCPEHSNEFTTCAGGEGLHHLDCRFACASCTACARDERGA